MEAATLACSGAPSCHGGGFPPLSYTRRGARRQLCMFPAHPRAGHYKDTPVDRPTLTVSETPAVDATGHAVSLHVNGQHHQLALQPWVTLLDLLRDRLDLTGTKKGCDHGQCGACTVLVDGKRINACLTLAVMQDGRDITTVEGMADGADLRPLQQAFIAHDAFQCGYCTPGQLCSAMGLMNEGQARTEADLRELMSGNICRCGAYPQIVQAIGEVMGVPVGQTDDTRRRIVIGTVPA